MTKTLYKLPYLYDADGDVSKIWYVAYSVFNPSTQKMVRKKITKKINSTRPADRYTAANTIIATMTDKLIAGYNPYMTQGRSSLLNYATGKPISTKNDIEYYMNEYLKNIKPRVRKSSYQHYQSKFRIFYEYGLLNNCMHLHQWNAIRADSFILHLSHTDRSASTINAYIRLCKDLFEFVNKYTYIENPFEKIARYKELKKPALRIKTSDVVKFVEYTQVNDPILLLFCRFIMYNFIRPHAELRFTKLSWIDFDKQNYNIPASIGKNGKEYTLPIPRNKLLDQLMEYRYYNPNDYLFTSDGVPGPKCMSINYWATRFNDVRDLLNMNEKYTVYSFKHTGAIMLHDSGASLKEIQMQMRHHSLDETDKYLRQMMAVESDHIRNSGPNY